MLAAYINSLVLWLRQNYHALLYFHHGSSEAISTCESIHSLLKAIHCYLYESPFHLSAWCTTSPHAIDVTKW